MSIKDFRTWQDKTWKVWQIQVVDQLIHVGASVGAVTGLYKWTGNIYVAAIVPLVLWAYWEWKQGPTHSDRDWDTHLDRIFQDIPIFVTALILV